MVEKTHTHTNSNSSHLRNFCGHGHGCEGVITVMAACVDAMLEEITNQNTFTSFDLYNTVQICMNVCCGEIKLKIKQNPG